MTENKDEDIIKEFWDDPNMSKEDKIIHLQEELNRCHHYLNNGRNHKNKKITQMVLNKKILYDWLLKDLTE